MVSWLRTYGTTAKLRASCECAHRTVLYSSDAGIKVSGHDPLWNYTDVWSSVDSFLETISVLFVEVTKQHLSSLLDQKGHTTSICGLFSFDIGSDYSYQFPLRPLCKGEALELFSVERQLLSSQKWRLNFPAAEMQEFVHSLSYLIHVFPNQVRSSRMKKRMNNLTKWISTQMRDLLLADVNSQPLAYRWYWEDLLNVKSSSTSWFY